MNDTPNQTQIEPSAEAAKAVFDYLFDHTNPHWMQDSKTALKIAYAIDLAPIIAERDQMRLALEIVETSLQTYGDNSVIISEHFARVREIVLAILEPKP